MNNRNKNTTNSKQHFTFNEVNITPEKLNELLVSLSKKQLSDEQLMQLICNSDEVTIIASRNNT